MQIDQYPVQGAGGGFSTPAGQSPMIYPPHRHRRGGHPLLLLGAIVGVLLVIVGVIVFVLLNNNKKPKAPATTQQQEEQTTSNEGPQPATAVDTEQTSNAISQDISSVNDDKDLPATQLDDKTLGL